MNNIIADLVNWMDTNFRWIHKLTFRATMNLLFFSRAKYTLPNLPFPKGFPMSKSAKPQVCFCAGFPFCAEDTAADASLLLDRGTAVRLYG